MKSLKSTAFAALLTFAIASTASAGTITGSRSSRTGTITGSRTGTITGSRTGTITDLASVQSPALAQARLPDREQTITELVHNIQRRLDRLRVECAFRVRLVTTKIDGIRSTCFMSIKDRSLCSRLKPKTATRR